MSEPTREWLLSPSPDREALWAKFTGGEKLAYGCGHRDGYAEARADTIARIRERVEADEGEERRCSCDVPDNWHLPDNRCPGCGHSSHRADYCSVLRVVSRPWTKERVLAILREESNFTEDKT